MTKQNFYAVTGGPGAGKTTLLQLLAAKGIPHIPEAARAIIKNRLQAGLPPRPAPAEFALQIFNTDRTAYTSSLHVTTPLFFDRTFIDSALMLQMADRTQFAAIQSFIQNNRFNSTVFIAPPWAEIYTTDTERNQTFDEAIAGYNYLYKWYHRQGYTLCVLPKCPVEERVDFIMNKIYS
jgi:predicted ATPase